MAPPKGKKRSADQADLERRNAMADQQIPTKTGASEESPAKRRKVGITLSQKQALIDNLQLERKHVDPILFVDS